MTFESGTVVVVLDVILVQRRGGHGGPPLQLIRRSRI
jgi:hypothetical protein